MSTESGLDIWRIISAVTAFLSGSAILAGIRWVFRIESKQRELDSWRITVDKDIDQVKADSTSTHDVVIVTQTQVEFLTADLKEVKEGQQGIMAKLTELLSRIH